MSICWCAIESSLSEAKGCTKYSEAIKLHCSGRNDIVILGLFREPIRFLILLSIPLQRLSTPLFWARIPSPIFPTNLYSKFHCLHLRCIVVLRWIYNGSTVHINNWLFDSNSNAFCILQPFFIFRNIPQYKLQWEMSVLWFFSFFVLICIFQIHFFGGEGSWMRNLLCSRI